MLSVTSTKHPQIWYDMEVKDLERVSTGIILITRTCAALISLTPKKKFRKSALDFVYIVGQLKSLQRFVIIQKPLIYRDSVSRYPFENMS